MDYIMKKASIKDKPLVTNILLKAFKNDPHTMWLLEKSRDPMKLNILVDYVFDETIRKGEIFLSDDNNAAALWDSEKKEKLSFNYIYRNLNFLAKIGFSSVIRILRSENMIHNNFHKYKKYCHLYLIGVLPEAQGKGLASKLMNPVIDKMKHLSIPIFLETANPINVEIYKKKGFSIYKKLSEKNSELFLMSIE
jgi:ribosomal protein S18 acetylase RimI-like enzyme